MVKKKLTPLYHILNTEGKNPGPATVGDGDVRSGACRVRWPLRPLAEEDTPCLLLSIMAEENNYEKHNGRRAIHDKKFLL